MINFAAILPHPAIMIPKIGEKEDLKELKKTAEAMEKMRLELEKADPETIIIISPHAKLDPGNFVINSSFNLEGDFTEYGLDSKMRFKNDLEFVEAVKFAAAANEMNDIDMKKSYLDHGALVPLYFLTRNIKPKLVHLAYSFMSLKEHFDYGQMLGAICERSVKKYAVIASADLSHRLKPGAQEGYSEEAEKFDRMIITYLKTHDLDKMINFDMILEREAGECGLRSILILLGMIGAKYDFNMLSYEAPFGVGYLTAKLV